MRNAEEFLKLCADIYIRSASWRQPLKHLTHCKHPQYVKKHTNHSLRSLKKHLQGVLKHFSDDLSVFSENVSKWMNTQRRFVLGSCIIFI